MLGWFKKKFSKKKTQETEEVRGPGLEQDIIISDKEQKPSSENVTGPREEAHGHKSPEPVTENRSDIAGKEVVEEETTDAGDSGPEPETSGCHQEEGPSTGEQSFDEGSFAEEPTKDLTDVESSDTVLDREPVSETVEESDEASLEETFSEILQTTESESGPEFFDQSLEELLAPEQPDEGPDLDRAETFDTENTTAVEEQVVQSSVEDFPSKEPVYEEQDAASLSGIFDQPLEELLAGEQPEEELTPELTDTPEQVEVASPDEEEFVATAEEVTTPKQSEEKSLFQRLQERLGKTRQGLLYRLDSIFLGKKEIDEELLDELEEILITSDLGVETTLELLDSARRQVKRKELSDPQALKKILRDKILGFLLLSDQPAELVMPDSGPFVIMVVGVNGVGKTTTIGKIANKFKKSGQSVLLIAGDTFRAAAIDQLKIWAERVGVEIAAGEPGVDPSSVVFDGLAYGVEHDFDAIIIDTAGRLHTSVNLMEELKKIRRVVAKKMDGAPHEVLLVLDATTGQNSISQAKLFGEAVGVSGLALTKLDGTAKGGIVANVCRELKIPVRFIGIGEQMDDLRDFDAREFVDALFAAESVEPAAA